MISAAPPIDSPMLAVVTHEFSSKSTVGACLAALNKIYSYIEYINEFALCKSMDTAVRICESFMDILFPSPSFAFHRSPYREVRPSIAILCILNIHYASHLSVSNLVTLPPFHILIPCRICLCQWIRAARTCCGCAMTSHSPFTMYRKATLSTSRAGAPPLSPSPFSSIHMRNPFVTFGTSSAHALASRYTLEG